MATEGTNDVCDLVPTGTLVLEDKDSPHPWYKGLLVSGDMVMVADCITGYVQLYRRHDGKFLARSHKLDSPCGIFHINEIEIGVVLVNNKIEVLSVQFVRDSHIITSVRTLTLHTGFVVCHAAAKLMDTVVVSGDKKDTMCWCIVSLSDGHVDAIFQICKGYGQSYLAIKNNMIYISCQAGFSSAVTGLWAYNIWNPSTCKFVYTHNDLKLPSGVTVDTRGFIFVCNEFPPCIHQLTDRCELVNVYKQGMPSRLDTIFWDQHYGHLYLTSDESNVITRYRPVYCSQNGIPVEILNMDDRSIQLFEEALIDGKERVYNIRIMVVGHHGVGKTTLVKRLLGEEVNISERCSTEGIDVYVNCCDVSLSTHEWTRQGKDSEQDYRLQRLVRVLNEMQSMKDKATHEEQVIIPPQGETTHKSHEVARKAVEGEESEVLYICSPQQDSGHDISSTASQQIESSPALAQREPIQSETNMIAMLKLLQENVYKLKQVTDKTSPLTVWDFAGQYAFYTTHQAFLTRRAIYILVSDVSKQLTDLVADECYFDSEGKMRCKVHELIEVWLNYIHFCASSPESNIPPVILVGTHVDNISQINHHEICEKYFRKIRTYLHDKPTRFHLVDEDFAIDNTIVDSKLEDLKRKILEVASQQPYWGEQIPARWLPLEQELMRLKAAGIKVIPRILVEDLSQAVVKISTDELDLFLRYLHDIGIILYFSMEILKNKIVLDPQWMIDALKSLITAEMFVLRSIPSVAEKWTEFKESGTLSPELIDALWTKEKNPDFHDNREHILLLMEQMNIIAKPKSWSEDSLEIKEEKYFIAPCMLREKTPADVIYPKSHPQIKSSSVLCCVFTGKYLPSPIFHRLLAACITRWPIAQRNMEKLIFCGCCSFEIDHTHRLILYFREYVIFARVIKMSNREEYPDQAVCIEVRLFIDTNLSEIIGYLGSALRYDWYIQCPQSKGDSLEIMFPVSELQKWKELPCFFHDKGHMVSSSDVLTFWFKDQAKREPILQDHINHYRLEIALRCICADALKKILLRHVPAQFTDIYQAIKANETNLVSRRLNKEQCKLVFPGPHDVGKVEDFDISLLYTLIRNVSSIQPPLTGWGNPTRDQPVRDTTLEANVERIRIYRNHISGHSVDGKCSQQEFEDYWKQIEFVLSDIESALGKQGYREELEKCKNQSLTY